MSAPDVAARSVIQDARVFDGIEMACRPTQVEIVGHRIGRVGDDLDVSGATVVDAEGCTVLPGLIEAHAHIGSPGALARALRFGVTTVMDMFMDRRLAADLRSARNTAGACSMADLWSAGALLTVSGGHGTQQLVGEIPTIGPETDVQAFVDARVAEGSDYIKIVYDDFSAYGHALPTLTFAQLGAAVEAAHRRGKLAVVHVGTLPGAADAVRAGADCLAHWVADGPLGPGLLDEIRARGVCVIPTLSMLNSICGVGNAKLCEDPLLATFLSERDRGNLSRRLGPPGDSQVELGWAMEAVRAMANTGVAILAGTDAPFPGMTIGASLHGELELLVDAGLTPTQALAAATSGPARTFGLEMKGRLRPGSAADVVLVRGDPTEDISATRDIVAIWKAGVAVDRRPPERHDAERPDVPPDGALIMCDRVGMRTTFGAGLAPVSDERVGGRSTSTITVVDEPSALRGWAIEVTGALEAGVPAPWAGLAVHPGAERLAPANLSDWSGLEIHMAGDQRPATVMLVLASRGTITPSTVDIRLDATWRVHELPWTVFEGSDGHDVQAIVVAVGGPPGPFSFRIGSLRLLADVHERDDR